MNYDIEINGEWYISVRGTAKAYEVDFTAIHYHIKQNPDNFEDHIIDLNDRNALKNFQTVFSTKQKQAHGKWLDKFVFTEIGTLLNNSPKTIPIKMWKSKLAVRAYAINLGVNFESYPNLDNFLSKYLDIPYF